MRSFSLYTFFTSFNNIFFSEMMDHTIRQHASDSFGPQKVIFNKVSTYVEEADSVESPVVAQQQVFLHGAGNVQMLDSRVEASSQMRTQRAATEMLQGARLTAAPTHQVKERPVLLSQGGAENALQQGAAG